METIYTLYEAKRLAEVVPGVGEASIDAIEPSGAMREWSDNLEQRCRELFRKLGPKLDLSQTQAEKLFEFRGGYLEPPEEEATATSA